MPFSVANFNLCLFTIINCNSEYNGFSEICGSFYYVITEPEHGLEEPQIYVYTKITQNRDLNITPETMKLLEENIGGKFLDIGLGYNFFNLTSKEKATKAKVSETTSNLKASAQQRKTSTK